MMREMFHEGLVVYGITLVCMAVTFLLASAIYRERGRW